MKAIRILIGDDHQIDRMGMVSILRGLPDIEIIDVATHPYDVLQKVELHKPDVVLLDLIWYDDKQIGLTICQHITRDNAPTQVVAISIDKDLKNQAHFYGANRVLDKSSNSDIIAEAIRYAYRHRVEPNQIKEIPRYEKLTEREMDVLKELAKGKTNAEIGEALLIGTGGVKTHLENILLKLHAKNRLQAVLIAYHHKLITLLWEPGSE